jgi:hypothetical protein
MYRSTACSRILLTICLLLGLTVPGNTQSSKRGQQGPRGIQAVPTTPSASPTERRVALVIGNSAYQYRLPPENWRNFWRQAVSHSTIITCDDNQKTTN